MSPAKPARHRGFTLHRRLPIQNKVVLALALLLAAAGLTLLGPSGRPAAVHAASSAGGDISRAEVLDRAQYWYDHRSSIQYNQGGSYPDPNGRDYRTDCSGFVSMAWHLSNQVSTSTLSTVAHRISKSELAPGDVLTASSGAGSSYGTGHVAIFVRWTSLAETSYLAYEFGQTPVQYHEIPYPYFPNDGRTFLPYRYDNIVDDPASSGAAVYENGQVHLFSIKDTGGSFWQDTYADGDWSGWQNLAGTLAGNPATTYHDSRFDVYGVSPGGTMYTKHWTVGGDGWSGWSSIGDGVFASGSGAAAVYENGQTHLFGLSPSGVLYQDTFKDGGWTGWQNLGGILTGTPAVTYHDGRFDVFGLSPSGRMFHMYWTSANGWSDWAVVGDGVFATAKGTGAGAVYVNGNYHVFCISPGGDLYSDVWTGSWSGWNDLGGTVAGTPSVIYHDGIYNVYAQSPGGTMFSKTYNSGWGDWHSLDGNFS